MINHYILKYTHEFWDGTSIKLLGSRKDSMQFELEAGPPGQRLCADVTAVKNLSGHPCLIFYDMHQDILFYFLENRQNGGKR